ncbi:MAG: PAS domain S-box protein, partial [Flaviramulus sp.]
LYILLGAVQYLQTNLGSSVSFQLFDDYQIYPSSIILFSSILYAVLLIYIKEGVTSARTLIIGIVLSNVIMSFMFEITYLQQIIESQIKNTELVTNSAFNVNFNYLFFGTIILFVDFLLLVILYQFLVLKFKKLPYFLILFTSLWAILIFDSLAFNIAIHYGNPEFKTSLLSHILGKSIAALGYSTVLYFYVKYLDGEKSKATFIANQGRDVLSIVHYKEEIKNLQIEKKQVEEKLTFQLENTLNNISDGFISLDSSWCYTFVNKKAGELLGRTPSSLIGKHIWTEFPEGVGLPFYNAYYKAAETQETQYFQEYYKPFDRWFENKIYPSSEGLTIYFTDVTEKKKSELALKESENHIRTILETEPECIKQLNINNELIYMNPAGLALIEADNLESVKGLPVLNLINEEYREAFAKVTSEAFNGNASQLVFELTGMKGTTRWLETNGVPLKDADGNIISLLAITRDITNRKKVEEQLVKNEQLYRSLTSNAPVAIFQTDSEGSCNYVNEEWIKYAGMSFEDAMGYGWANAIHPEDKERVVYEWEQSVVNKTEFNLEFRFQNKKNQITWLSAKAVGLFNSQNKLYGYIGMSLDITERKENEKLLIENKEYLDSIINNIADPVFVKDAKSQFLIANDAFYKLFNRTEDEIIGNTFAEDVPEEERERYLEIDKRVISEGVENIHEDSFKVKGGETRYISTKKSRYIDGSGNKFLIGVIRDVTKQKNTEKLVLESKEYLDNIINNIGDPVFVKDDKSYLLIVNDAFCRMFGLKREAIIGKTLAEDVTPEEMEVFLRIDKQVINTGVENINEEYLTLKGKEPRIISTKKTRYVDEKGDKYIIGVIRDITEKKKAEENNQMLLSLIETSDDFIGLATLEGKPIYLNSLGKKMVGLEADEALPSNIKDFFTKKYYDAIENEHMPSIFEKERWNGEAEFKNFKSEGIVSVEMSGFLVRDKIANKPIALGIVATNISVRKKAEIELEKHKNNLEDLVESRTAELEKEKIKAQSADLMKSAFLATMSHELRTPMNSIIGFTGILLKELAGPLNDEQKRQIDMVKNSGEHLLGLINDVLDISKIEAGKLKVSFYSFNYLVCLEKTVDFLLPQASKKGLKISTEISTLEINLVSDERRVEQILLNLISNAIKFSTNGTILVKVDIKDNVLITQVIDEGIGISKADIVKLFVPFIQIEGGLNRSHEGTGLGLAICKNLIDKLGGTINVNSQLGKGSIFTFKLPLDNTQNKLKELSVNKNQLA